MPDQNYSYYRRFLQIRKRDEVLTYKLMDFANLGSIALLFSQLSEGFHAVDFFLGAVLFIAVYTLVGYYLSRFN